MMTERLSAMDASFLAHARPEHVLGVRLLVFDGPAPGFDAFLEHVRGRLPTEPRLRQRVRRGRLELRRPRWQVDRDFDLERHVLPMRLAPGGSGPDLEALSGALLNLPMALDRPLWEIRYLEGLSGGRFAAGVRLHHTLGDGDANTRLVAKLFPPVAGGGEASVREGPVVARQSRRAGLAPADVSGAPRLAETVGALHPRRRRRQARRLAHQIALARQAGLTAAPARPSGVERSVRLLSVPLSELRLAGRTFETTVNNLVVAAVAGALRRSLSRRRSPAVNSVALIPVSVRRADDPELGNRAVAIRYELPIAEPEALERLGYVTDSLTAAVSAARAAGLREEVIGPQFLRDRLTRRPPRRERPFDLIISSTRGPTAALTCRGSQAELVLASGPNIEFGGPLIRVASYLDSLTVAVTADPEQVPDLAAVVVDLRASFDELVALARGSAADAGHPSGARWVGAPWPRSITSSP